jgi:hypothetical protein
MGGQGPRVLFVLAQPPLPLDADKRGSPGGK